MDVCVCVCVFINLDGRGSPCEPHEAFLGQDVNAALLPRSVNAA